MTCQDCKTKEATQVVIGVVEHWMCDRCYKSWKEKQNELKS